MECSIIQNNGVQFFWWAFIAYAAALVLYITYIVTEKNKISYAATGGMGIGFVFLTLGIIVRWCALKHPPLGNMFEFITVFSWFVGVFYFIFLMIYKKQILGAFISAIIFMLIAAASLLPKQVEMQLVPALQSIWLQIHVTLAAFGEAAFAIAFAANIMYLIKLRISKESKFSQRLPELNKLDIIGYKAIQAGYPLFTIGALFAGAVWAEQAWGSFWSWDPKEVGSLIVWLVYSAYLHARLVKGWSGKRAAILSALGFICTLLTFFANLFLSGLHAYG
jgi:cytochrome c-type biogenesis protein CcsB